MVDSEGQEFVFRQPSSADQIQQLIGAAYVDPFEGYGADGDNHWTHGLIQGWWRARGDMLVQEPLLRLYNADVDRWKRSIDGEYELYLRRYAFFVEERRVPDSSDSLPHL